MHLEIVDFKLFSLDDQEVFDSSDLYFCCKISLNPYFRKSTFDFVDKNKGG